MSALQSQRVVAPRRLHIGGIVRRDGWRVMNVVPGDHVDVVGTCTDLSMFDDASLDEVYASHVFEHLSYAAELEPTLQGVRRALRKDGLFYLSVPDLDVLAQLFAAPATDPKDRFHIMRMMFGGQTDAHDYHKVGLNWDFLCYFAQRAGFQAIRRVERFGLFDDTSNAVFMGRLISLNAVLTA